MESCRHLVSVPVKIHKTTRFMAIDKEVIRLCERMSSTLHLGQHLKRVCVDTVEMEICPTIGKQLRFLALPLFYLPAIIRFPAVPHEILNTVFHHERRVHPTLARKSRIVVVPLLLDKLNHAYTPLFSSTVLLRKAAMDLESCSADHLSTDLLALATYNGIRGYAPFLPGHRDGRSDDPLQPAHRTTR